MTTTRRQTIIWAAALASSCCPGGFGSAQQAEGSAASMCNALGQELTSATVTMTSEGCWIVTDFDCDGAGIPPQDETPTGG